MPKHKAPPKRDKISKTNAAKTNSTEAFSAKIASQSFITQQIQVFKLLAALAAKGDGKAFTSLVHLTITAVLEVDELTASNLSLAKTVAAEEPFWPTYISASEKFYPSQKDLAKRLGLASKYEGPINFKRAFREMTMPRIVALWLILLTDDLRCFGEELVRLESFKELRVELPTNAAEVQRRVVRLIDTEIEHCNRVKLHWLKSIISSLEMLATRLEITYKWEDVVNAFISKAHALPPLSKNAMRDWSEFGKQVLLFLTDGHPEENQVLREIGKYRQNAYYRKDTTNSTFAERVKKAKDTENTNIRDGIFTRLRSAYPKVLGEGHMMAREPRS